MTKYQLTKIDGTLVSEYNSIEEINDLLESDNTLGYFWFDTNLIEDLTEQHNEHPENLENIVIIKQVEE